MFSFLIIVQVIISILLVVVVLMQASKGGGLAGTFGGGSVGTMFGVRRTADFLIRATQILAGTFLALSLIINIFFLPRGATAESIIQKGMGGQVTTPAATTPQLPPAQGEQPAP
ncbi:MAG: preprotein translocase subunit SecG [Bacteroidota bacterium]